MSRTLLIVICDFLLLSLLALARFDVADTGGAEGPGEEERALAENIRADQDMLEILKLSLEAEKESREDVVTDLDEAQRELEERERAIAEREEKLREMSLTLEEREREQQRLQQERDELEGSRAALEREVSETEERRAALERQVEEAEQTLASVTEEAALRSEEARRERERALEMERQLRERMEQLEEMQSNLATLEERQREAEEAHRRMENELELSESEKRLIRENLDQAREEVRIVRRERERVEEQARELATGVTRLAERSGELSEEIRRSQPKTPNSIYSEFLENRVEASFFAARNSLLGPVHRSQSPNTILISFGDDRIFAVFHIRETGLSLSDSTDWERLTGRLSREETRAPIRQIGFLAVDPRVVVVPVDPNIAEELGAFIYPVATEPFKFSEAVLVGASGDYYGESPFRLNSNHPRYVRMETRVLSRFSGDFSPSAGDLVFSKTGEVIGLMINREFCVLLDSHLPAARLQFGENIADQQTGGLLSQLKSRLDTLPARIRN